MGDSSELSGTWPDVSGRGHSDKFRKTPPVGRPDLSIYVHLMYRKPPLATTTSGAMCVAVPRGGTRCSGEPGHARPVQRRRRLLRLASRGRRGSGGTRATGRRLRSTPAPDLGPAMVGRGFVTEQRPNRVLGVWAARPRIRTDGTPDRAQMDLGWTPDRSQIDCGSTPNGSQSAHFRPTPDRPLIDPQTHPGLPSIDQCHKLRRLLGLRRSCGARRFFWLRRHGMR